MVMNYADEHTLKDGLEQVALWNSAFLASSDLGTQCARTHTHTHVHAHTRTRTVARRARPGGTRDTMCFYSVRVHVFQVIFLQ